LFDRNSDGKLSKQEVKNGYLKHFNHKISEADLNKIFNDFDTDKNGFIDLNEVSG
jgi:Ca2+-binding EF-hand superfamily protein